jgi:hypothetical protein
MRGSHAGARSFERSSTPEPFGVLGSRRGTRSMPIARRSPTARLQNRRIAGGRARQPPSHPRECGYGYGLVALPGAAPRSLAPRSSRGTSSHAPAAQLKIGRVPSTGVREGNALYVRTVISQAVGEARPRARAPSRRGHMRAHKTGVQVPPEMGDGWVTDARVDRLACLSLLT